jgi:hypothetical protein
MLGRLYDLPASAALRLTQAYHDSRIYPQGVRSPQTTVQRAQVSSLLYMWCRSTAAVEERGIRLSRCWVVVLVHIARGHAWKLSIGAADAGCAMGSSA